MCQLLRVMRALQLRHNSIRRGQEVASRTMANIELNSLQHTGIPITFPFSCKKVQQSCFVLAKRKEFLPLLRTRMTGTWLYNDYTMYCSLTPLSILIDISQYWSVTKSYREVSWRGCAARTDRRIWPARSRNVRDGADIA